MQYIIERQEPEEQFIHDRAMAIDYTDRIALKYERGMREYFRWIKTELSSPSFDDFTFGFRNQVFSVLVLRVDNRGRLLNPPPRIEALRREAKRNNLVPCVFPIRDDTGRLFFPNTWNRINPFTGQKVDPHVISSDAPVKMSDWELLNWSVEIVYTYIAKEGLELFSFTDAPEVDPQIWFRDKEGKTCWVKVLCAAYPEDVKNLTFSFEGWHKEVLKYDGYIARVGFMDSEGLTTLFRTRGAFVGFRGIEKIYSHE